MRWLLVALLCAACAAPAASGAPCAVTKAPVEPQGPVRHVVVVSVDGLVPDAYLAPDAHGLVVPTLRRLAARGARSTGTLSVFPSVTYPSHTTMATGVRPARHGIVSNAVFDPLGLNKDAWYWYAEENAAQPVWRAAFEAGYRTALVSWPATVGAKATWLVPEIWRSGTPEDGKLIRALSTPGLLEAVAAHTPGFAHHFTMPTLSDEGGADVVVHLLERERPHLVMLHMVQVDEAQHGHGLWSAEAIAAIENADRQLGRMIAASERGGIGKQTVFVVLSDHGFMNVSRQVNPGTLLREAGLLTLDAAGKVTAWKAAVRGNSGSMYVYLADPNDAATAATVEKIFRDRVATPDSGIGRLLDRAMLAELGGDPRALLALEGAPGVCFGSDLNAYEVAPRVAATHGYDPNRPDMKASLLISGESIASGVIEGARLVDVAPTVARWLGIALPDVEGRPLL
jgi:predicted AlkP superfamily pyrophosphatase or phosphodiesterase